MAASPLHVVFGLTGAASSACAPAISAFRLSPNLILVQGLHEIGGFDALSHLAAKAWCGKSRSASRDEGMPPEELEESLWQEFLSDPSQWWDNRRGKRTPRHPDFRHKNSRVALWLDYRHKPAWWDSRLATWDAGMKGPSECVSTSARRDFGNSAAHDDMPICEKLCEDGQIAEAVDELTHLVQRGCHVPNNLFYRALKRCTAQKDLVLGRRIHALTITSGYEGDAFLATHLMGLYASCGRLEEALRVFTTVSSPDAYNWAIIIFAYARHGQATQAIALYRQMRESNVKPDSHVYIAVLKACGAVGDLAAGKNIHAHISASPGKPDIVVQNCLVDMYAKCGSIKDARGVFDELPQRVEATWNTMITGYAQQGMGQEALGLYRSMQQQGLTKPGYVTFVCVLQACAAVGAGALHHGKQLHAQIEDRGLQDDVVLGCSLVNMYAKCGSLEDAREVFDRLKHKNVVTWTAMIAGYTQQGMGQKALSIYSSMQQEGIAPPNCVTFTCLLQACACVGAVALQQGKELHAQIKQRALQDDAVVGGSLVYMYAKCGNIVDARRVFDRLPHRNVAAWNAMITGYAQQDLGQEALTLYSTMQQEGINPDSLTFLGLLQACATLAALPLGKNLHVQIEERGLQADMVVGAALVNMYAKCGSMVDTQQVFDSLPARNIESWGALVAGYTHQGDSEAVFDLLERMRLEGIQPNGIIFLSVLTVCSHVGLVDKGKKYFRSMLTEHCISPTIEHYTCLINLLGRAGHLDEALQMAKTMPFPADGAVWVTLLGACQKWNDVEIGRQAFEFATSLDKNDASPYVLMSNIYAGAQMCGDSKEMQARRTKLKAWKQPGQSWWTDMGGEVHAFVVRDMKHPKTVGTCKPCKPGAGPQNEASRMCASS